MNEPKTDSGDGLAAANRVSIRALLADDGEDVNEALAQAGIVDPVAIPVQLDPTGGFLGDGVTANLTGILEPDEAGDEVAEPAADPRPPLAGARSAPPATAMLPPECGMQAYAPVRKRLP